MIEFTTGNMFDDARCDIYIDPVNCEGISGGGLAWEFKNRFPQSEAWYRKLCLTCDIQPGVLMFDRDFGVIYFPTKDKLRKPSLLSYVELGLQSLVKNHIRWNLNNVAVPALGCGLGGLDWKLVKPLTEKYLAPLNVNFYGFAPHE